MSHVGGKEKQVRENGLLDLHSISRNVRLNRDRFQGGEHSCLLGEAWRKGEKVKIQAGSHIGVGTEAPAPFRHRTKPPIHPNTALGAQ